MYCTPNSRAASSTFSICFAPCLCPSILGSPRSFAHLPLPSIMIATCRGFLSFGGVMADGSGIGNCKKGVRLPTAQMPFHYRCFLPNLAGFANGKLHGARPSPYSLKFPPPLQDKNEKIGRFVSGFLRRLFRPAHDFAETKNRSRNRERFLKRSSNASDYACAAFFALSTRAAKESALRAAPPMRPPSMSFSAKRASAFSGFIEPP